MKDRNLLLQVFPDIDTLPDLPKIPAWQIPEEDRDRLFQKQLLERDGLSVLQQTGLPKKYWKATLEKVQPLFLYGKPGAGKTFYAAGMLKSIVWHSFEHYYSDKAMNLLKHGMFIVVPELLFNLRNSFSTGNRNFEQETIEKLCSVEYLFLDDLGGEEVTEYVQRILYVIINHRYNEELFTTITSNSPVKKLSQFYGDRITSRLSEMCLSMECSGKDWRLS